MFFFDPDCEIISSECVKAGQVLVFVTELLPHMNKVVKRSQFGFV